MAELKQLRSTDIAPVFGDVPMFDGSNFVPQAPSPVGPLTHAFDCPVSVNPLDAVYISGSNAVDAADANDPTKQPFIGLVRSKPNPTTALVQFYGVFDLFPPATLIPRAKYFLSTTPGQITTTPLEISGCIVDAVGLAISDTAMVLMVDSDFTEIE